ncbi:MAG: hypothetical protein KKF39_04620 [Nanoarchaeota archaeon]|nr:hypothetical protein [Nanoarchaeota archaeon]
MLLLAILVISAINIQRDHDFDYSSLQGWKSLVVVYFSWLGSVVSSITKVIGYAIKQEWIASGNVTT